VFLIKNKEGFNQIDYRSTVCESVETELFFPVKLKWFNYWN